MTPPGLVGARGLKNTKWVQYAAILLGVFLLWGLFVFLLAGDQKKSAAKKDDTDPGKVAVKAISAPGEGVTDAQRWLYKAGDDITTLKGRVEAGEALNRELLARLAAVEEKAKQAPGASAQAAPLGPNKVAPPTPVYPPGTPSSPGATPVKFVPPPVPGAAVEASGTGPGAMAERLAPPAPPKQPGIGRVSLNGAPGAKPGAAPSQAASQAAPGVARARPEAEREAGKSFLPIGFVRGRLLNGIDAPTSGVGQANPLPVFIHLEDLAWLPNHWRANVKDCMVTAAGYGDLPARRAYFRLEKLSCVRHDGRVLEQNVSGTVHGEDGKSGMLGRVVTQQGQILANALLAGVVSGIGKGVVYQSSTTGVTALGTVITDADKGKEFESGIGQGINGAMDRLAQYYISLADRMHPIIEIDAQRAVDVAFTRGTALDVPLPDTPDMLALRGAGTPRRP
jgi:conjugal transfer pilus assembly protein TraB